MNPRLIAEVRPSRVLTFAEAEAAMPTSEYLLVHGAGDEAVDAFERIAPTLEYGSVAIVADVDMSPVAKIQRAVVAFCDGRISHANMIACFVAVGNDEDALRLVTEINEFLTSNGHLEPDALRSRMRTNAVWHALPGRLDRIARSNDFRIYEPPGVPDNARAFVKSEYNGDTNGTHWPHLAEAVRRTTGPVLELGSGDSSTKRLHDLLEGTGRRLVTVESRQIWADKFTHLKTDWHTIEVCEDPATSPRLDEEWGVVFVDHAPGETRTVAIDRARDLAEYVVVHDTEELSYGVEPLLDTFKYRKDFRRARPWTTVASETRPVW